jgi:hypothetical protein
VSTTLAFKTHAKVSSGGWSSLGTVDVHEFTQIRVLAYTNRDSAAAAKIHLIMIEGEESVGSMDILSVEVEGNVSRVYDVPGKNARARKRRQWSQWRNRGGRADLREGLANSSRRLRR